jgi:hypothetical protein
MSRLTSAGFLLAMGAALLWMTLQGYRNGELNAGSALLGPYRPNREDNPLGFHCHLALYFCCGLGLCVWGLLALIGMAAPLKWR